MKGIRWSPAAASDLEEIHNYLDEHHPTFVQTTIRKLYDAARSLKQMPQRGRIGLKPGTREMVLSPLPYIIVYGVEAEMVHISACCTHRKTDPSGKWGSPKKW